MTVKDFESLTPLQREEFDEKRKTRNALERIADALERLVELDKDR